MRDVEKLIEGRERTQVDSQPLVNESSATLCCGMTNKVIRHALDRNVGMLSKAQENG